MFLDRDRFFTIAFTKYMMLMAPIFGGFTDLMNEFTHPFMQYQKKTLSVANSANQNHGFKCSIINPAKPKLETKWLSGKQQFIRFKDFSLNYLKFLH